MSYVSQAIDQRVDSCRCVSCNGVIVDAYFCDECGFNELGGRGHYQDDRRSVTATQISRSMRRRVDQGAAHDQWMDIISSINAGVHPAEQTQAAPRHIGGKDTFKNPCATGRSRAMRVKIYEANFEGILGAFRETPRLPAFDKQTKKNYEVHDRLKARKVRRDAFRAAQLEQVNVAHSDEAQLDKTG